MMRKLIILVVCILLGLGIALVFSFIRNDGQYQATAKVKITPDEGEQIDINEELKAVKSGVVMERVASHFMETTEHLQNCVKAKTDQNAPNTILISANGKNEEEAKKYANQVADEYANQNAAKKRQEAAGKAAALEKKIKDEYRPQLREAEARLQQFMNENKPSSGGSKTAQVRSIDKQISRLNAEKSRLQRALNSLGKSTTPFDKLKSLPANYPQFYNLKNIRQLKKLQSELISLLQKYTANHPEVQKKSREIETTIALIAPEAQKAIAARISKIDTDVKPLLARQSELKSPANQSNTMFPGASRQTHENLKEDRDAKTETLEQNEAKLAELRQLAVNYPGNVSISPAEKASQALATPSWRTMLIGGAIGLLVGLIIAFFPRSSGLSPNKIASLEESLGLPILGVIPHIDFEAAEYQEAPELESLSIKVPPSPDGKPDVSVEVVTSDRTTIPGIESFRVLRTNILFKEQGKTAQSLLFTSEGREEGKTTITSNLAVSIAQSGKRTLLIDGNFQNPQVHELFGLNPVPGLTELLQRSAPIDEALRSSTDIFFGNMELEHLLKTPGIDNMHLLLVGERFPSAEELLASTELPVLLNELKGYYDIIMIDGSSISTDKEALIWSAKVDGVILIHRKAKPKHSVIKRTKKMLEKTGVNLWGVVLNDTKIENS